MLNLIKVFCVILCGCDGVFFSDRIGVKYMLVFFMILYYLLWDLFLIICVSLDFMFGYLVGFICVVNLVFFDRLVFFNIIV